DGSGRVVGYWYNNNRFTVDVNLTDGQAHYLALYFLDWGTNNARQERVQLKNSAGTVLDTETLTAFSGGVYLVWSISGHMTIQVTQLAGPNAVVNGLFFDPPAATATLIRRDTTTQGTWIGTYGTDGYDVAKSGSSYPSYATVNWNGTQSATWAANTSDPRALQKVTGSGRIAAGWWDSNSFTFYVNILDGQAHELSFYLLDWGGSNWRSERIQLIDAATGSVVDTQSASSFAGGLYLTWQVSGNLVIKITH